MSGQGCTPITFALCPALTVFAVSPVELPAPTACLPGLKLLHEFAVCLTVGSVGLNKYLEHSVLPLACKFRKCLVIYNFIMNHC